MRKEKTGAVLLPDPGIYEYGEGTSNEGKRDRQTIGKNDPTDSKKDPNHESTLEAEGIEVEDIDLLDATEISELMEFMEADDSVDDISQSSEEDEDSENVQRLYVNPRQIVSRAKKPRYMSNRSYTSEDTGEETREETRVIKSRWLMSSCRSCGDIIRFRANQPKPPTCGRPQCIEKLEGRNKNIALSKST